MTRINKRSKWWLITWNWPFSDWRKHLVEGFLLVNDEIKCEDLWSVGNGVERIIAAEEVASNGMLHIHAVIEFKHVIFYSQIRKHYNNVANLKALKKDVFGYQTPIKYIFKSNPPRNKCLFHPALENWCEYTDILKQFF